tara:strand:+ start:1418 stop:1954 length:537 start_codon:yes stop_codon:yes gene_type:complete
MIAEELKHAHFGCKLKVCRGNCCIDGDEGAPLEPEEARWVEENIEVLLEYLSEESRIRIANKGSIYIEDGVKHLTILPNNGACVFLLEEQGGYRRCLFEKLHTEGKIKFAKPISCHLFPLIFRQTQYHKILSFQRRDICKSSWSGGTHILKSLKSALRRKFGDPFVEELLQKCELSDH